MAKAKSGYKRSRYEPPDGITIHVSGLTYQRLKLVAMENITLIPPHSRRPIKKAIGYWCESHLWPALNHEKNFPLPPVQGPPGPPSDTHTFEISEELHLLIERFVKDKGRTAKHWIAAVVLRALAVEEERMRGAMVEADRFG